jgi:DNA-binding response OmpR family regulator
VPFREHALQAGAIRVDPIARTVTRAGELLSLTGRESDLLLHFVRSPGRAFTREQLLAAGMSSLMS